MPAVQMPVPICLNPNVSLAAIPVLARIQLLLHTNVHKCCHLRRKKTPKKPWRFFRCQQRQAAVGLGTEMRATANCTLIVLCVYFHQWDCRRLSHSPTFYNPNPLLLLTAQFKNISWVQLSGQIGTESSILLPRSGAVTQQEGTSRSLRARLVLFIFDCVSHQDMHYFLTCFKFQFVIRYVSSRSGHQSAFATLWKSVNVAIHTCIFTAFCSAKGVQSDITAIFWIAFLFTTKTMFFFILFFCRMQMRC